MPTPTGIPAADIAQAGIGAAEFVTGLINQGKTKREAERLARERPQYNISPVVGENSAFAKSELANGMGSAATKAYEDLNNSQFSSSLNAILINGGNANNIGELYGSNQEGRLRLQMMKDQLRLSQINNYLKTSENQQQEEQTQWQVNKYAPWADKAQANAAAREGASAQINSGLNSFGSAVGNYGQTVRERNQFALPTSINGNANFNSTGYATGVPNINTNAPTIQGTNTLTPMNFPTYP